MKPLISSLLLLLVLQGRAQYDPAANQLKVGLGYSQEFPGLNGYGLLAEYDLPVYHDFRAGIGTRWVDLTGNPRSPLVSEYTRAMALDFNFFWSPEIAESQVLSLGMGYSFSFWQTRRAVPVTDPENTKVLDWLSQDYSGRSSGLNLFAEYAYHFRESPFSLGMRAGWYKAYINGYFAGVVAGIQL